MYVQLAFMLDRVKAMAPHPEWQDTQPFKAALEDDLKTLAESGERGLLELVTANHAGMTTEEFQKIVTDWLATARHPRFKRAYTEIAYQPMIELIAYLRANGFKTFIVSGVPDVRRQARSVPLAGAQLHRRQRREAGRH
jgi:phosphoserine phosphatase